MEKLMKTSKTVDTILKVLYKIMQVAGIIILVGMGICIGAALLDQIPVSELTGISVNDVEIQFENPQQVEASYMVTEMVIVMALSVIVIITGCYLIKVLRKVLAPMTVGEPFDGTVSTNIKKLGIIVMVAGVLSDIVKAVGSSITLFMYDFSGIVLNDNVAYISVNHQISLMPVLTGVLVIMLSHVFRYGEELQQQADETL